MSGKSKFTVLVRSNSGHNHKIDTINEDTTLQHGLTARQKLVAERFYRQHVHSGQSIGKITPTAVLKTILRDAKSRDDFSHEDSLEKLLNLQTQVTSCVRHQRAIAARNILGVSRSDCK